MANPLRRMVSSSQVSDWFTNNTVGTLPVPSRKSPLTVNYLVVAGGGAGSSDSGGGGGAGGRR